ncbi:hypothetical protein SAMN05444380_12328 [Thermophagus xiamenensis]|uniref:Uncharacterized protein n=1 Tax=Thermophagus xiamenensis TaxID=385682 RepID=A0A1I2ELS0_9BACT|nr:hypothetical protein SAMN05444380_12328 [Thermophagus xiamenensis]
MELAWLNKIYKCPFVAKVAMLVSFGKKTVILLIYSSKF